MGTTVNNVVTLNVRLPFCEAVEYLRDEKSYVGAVNPTTGVTIFVSNNELFIKKDAKTVNLTVSDVMDADWYIMSRVAQPVHTKTIEINAVTNV